MLLDTTGTGSVDAFAFGFDRRARHVLKPTRIARIAARLRGQALDRALMRGADLGVSSQLAARAAQLTANPARERLADGLERLLRTARDPSSGRLVRPSGRAVVANAPELRELTSLLRGPTPLYAQGVAMLCELVTDGTGPVYTDPKGAILGRRLREIQMAIAQPDPLGAANWYIHVPDGRGH
jgi:hypothetical protein